MKTTPKKPVPILLGALVLVAVAGTISVMVMANNRSAPNQSEPVNEELLRGAKRKGVLSETQTAPPPEAGQSDDYQVVLAPYEGIELKYELTQGSRMAFQWSSTGKVRYDMHSHPYEGGEDLTESYGIADVTNQQGLYIAAFTGLHGWHWQNRTLEPVTLHLQASGPIQKSFVITDTSHEERVLNPVNAGN